MLCPLSQRTLADRSVGRLPGAIMFDIHASCPRPCCSRIHALQRLLNVFDIQCSGPCEKARAYENKTNKYKTRMVCYSCATHFECLISVSCCVTSEMYTSVLPPSPLSLRFRFRDCLSSPTVAIFVQNFPLCDFIFHDCLVFALCAES